jgi:hypothetical protein
MFDMGWPNEQVSKTQQTTYYNRKSRSGTFGVGQKALVLLPTNSSNLLASWKGPFVITDRDTPKNHIFSIFRGARPGAPPPPPGSAPADDVESSKREILAGLDDQMM